MCVKGCCFLFFVVVFFFSNHVALSHIRAVVVYHALGDFLFRSARRFDGMEAAWFISLQTAILLLSKGKEESLSFVHSLAVCFFYVIQPWLSPNEINWLLHSRFTSFLPLKWFIILAIKLFCAQWVSQILKNEKQNYKLPLLYFWRCIYYCHMLSSGQHLIVSIVKTVTQNYEVNISES